MIKTFPLDFIRVALEQTLLKEHIKNPYYFGGDNLVKISSFYEQLKTQDEVDRFVELYKEIADQQNRTGLVGNGVIVTSENPTLTNLYSALIIPLTWTCSLRVKLADRDEMVDTLFHLIDELKGSKVDIAELKCLNELGSYSYIPFMVGTIGHNEGLPYLNNGDYIGRLPSETPLNDFVEDKIDELSSLGINVWGSDIQWYYYEKLVYDGISDFKPILSVCYKKDIAYTDTETQTEVIDFAENNNNFDLVYTSDTDFDYIPDVATISVKFYLTDGDTQGEQTVSPSSYTASLVNGKLQIVAHFDNVVDLSDYVLSEVTCRREDLTIELSNIFHDITSSDSNEIIFPPEHVNYDKYKVSLSFDSLRVDTPRTINGEEYCEISFSGSATLVNASVKLGNDLVKMYVRKEKIVGETPYYFMESEQYLEPLEMPSGNGASSIPNLLKSNDFITNTHTDGIALRLQYSFVLDESITLLKEWFNYGRYGTQKDSSDNIVVSPNIIYKVGEYWSNWGNVELKEVSAKLVESVDIENTESDTLTLGITMQIQGDNN